jgi:hypothetical protein
MRLGAALVFVGTLLSVARAEATLRWELKPRVPPTNSFAHPLPLADGRLLVCTESDEAERCHVLDPNSGERLEVPVSGHAQRFASALALDDGKLLLAHEHALLELFSGKKRPLPAAPRQLSEMSGVTITGGRAAFVTKARCERVLFFMGAEAGFRDVVAAPAGTCVHTVFDLGDGRVLIARETASKKGNDWHIDFVSFDLQTLRFQLGPSLIHRHPVAVFVHRGGIVVLLHNTYRRSEGGIRSEALFIDRNMKRRSLVLFQQGTIGRQVARVDDDRWLIFDDAGSLLWDPTHGALARVPFPARSSAYFAVLRRAGTVFAFFYQTRDLFALSRVASGSHCAEVATYAANASADRSELYPPARIDELLSPDAIESCRHHLESTRRFPESIQLPLEALLQRRQGVATRDEQVAARVLCTLLPNYSLALVQRISAASHLDDISAKLCQEANVVLPVLSEAGTPRIAQALVRHGLTKNPGRVRVRWEVQRLLERRPELAHQAGPFLRQAHAEKAEGFDTLHMALCSSQATGELALACTEVGSDREKDFRPSPPNKDRPRLLRNLGIATGVIGGLTSLAYVDRDGGGGRAIAIGSGVIGGATLGFLGTVALAEPAPDMEGLGTLLLAAAVGAGGAIAGGAITTLTSRERGDARFASAAVPLGGVWLTTVGLTIDAW